MSDLSDKLSALLSDDESRKKLFDLASELRGSAAESSFAKDESTAADDASTGAASGPSPLSSLPNIMGMLGGGESSLDEKKLNLIKAIQPYLSDERVGIADRAIRMASLAKIAKDTLGLLGR